MNPWKTKIVAIANQKGGVGKSTTCLNLGHILSKVGKKVLYIDLDPQANGTQILSAGKEFETDTICDLYIPPYGKNETSTLKSLILPVEQRTRSNKRMNAPTLERIENYDFVPSSILLSSIIEQSLTLLRRESILDNKIKELGNEYDFILLDCPPNLSLTTINAIVAADRYMVVVDRGAFSMNGIKQLLSAMSQVKGVPISQLPFNIVQNRYRSGHKVNEKFDVWLNSVASHVFESRIRQMQDVENAMAEWTLVMHHKPSSLIKNDYVRVAQELFNHLKNDLIREHQENALSGSH
ncbi:ParA family protein [Vibrio sp. R78045]|uniref:ParA family protein n=1 Tax=Vibrio sp. R78045 TaxID=3093868 RepID=UPI0036F1E1EA